MSRRQLHEAEAGLNSRAFPVRACGMEARGIPQHRTQVKPRKAGLCGRTCGSTRRPISNRHRTVVGTAAAGSCSSLLQEISPGPHGGNAPEGNDAGVTPGEKSDHPIVARKLAKAGRAKGVMG
jgi:hypothetical protein